MQKEESRAQSLTTQDVENDACEQVKHAEVGPFAKSEQAANLDEQHQVLEKLLLAHETWFDVSRDYEYANRTFPGYAEFHSHGEKYVLVKRAKLWEVDAHEFIFFVTADALTGPQMQDCIAFMTTEALKKVDPEVPNHMTSYISLIVVANSVDDAARKLAKTRFHKEFKMGLQGWVDMRLGVVNLEKRCIYTNGMGKELEPQLRSALGLPAKKKFLRR